MIRRAPMASLVVSLLVFGLFTSFAATNLKTDPNAGPTIRRRAVGVPHRASSPPAAVADNYAVAQGATLTIAAPGVLGNDTTNGGTIVSYGATTGSEQTAIGTSAQTAQIGVVKLNADGSFTYTPASSFAGTDTFKYVLQNTAGSSTATVTFTVTAPPAAVADGFSAAKNTPLAVSAPGVLSNDTLNGATIVSYGATTGTEQTSIGSGTPTAQGGSVSLNANGDFSFNPATSFTGSDTFKYVLQNVAGSSTATVTVTVVAPPVTVADSFTTTQNTTLTVSGPGVLANDTTSGGTIVSYGASTGAEQTALGTNTSTAHNGVVALNSDGGFSYTPASSFSGSDTFMYVVQNAAGSSAATVTINVQTPVNTNLSVTSPGFFYSISGLSGENPVLTLVRGKTYTFQINTDAIHPFEILGAPSGSVINNNISRGTITFNVPNTAASYQYICSIHGFGNTINTTP